MYLWFVLLLLYGVMIRIFFVYPNVVAYLFDQGKDSLAVLHMIKVFSPKLIGPWTSIPGLFFGPAWYYLLAPGFIITQGNPMSAVATMIILSMIMAMIAYKKLGIYEAIIIICSFSWIGLSNSAWNPYPIAYTILIILIALQQSISQKQLSRSNVVIIGFFSGLSFHFSSAYAVFLLLCIPIIFGYRLIVKKQQITLKTTLIGLVAFAIPFLPQAIFEVRHNFLETKSVITYLSQPSVNRTTTPLLTIINSALGSFKDTTVPDFGYPWLNPLRTFIYVLTLITCIWVILVKRKIPPIWFELLVFTLIPIVGLSWTHFNVWYLTPLIAVSVFFIGHVLRHVPKRLLMVYFLVILIAPLVYLPYYYQNIRPSLLTRRDFLPTKERILNYIYSTAGTKPFAVYHYIPEIYDFGYQYLYFQKAQNGFPLPVDFSYKPGELNYIPEKQALLNKFPSSNKKPELIFYVVETPFHQEYLDEWWTFQKYQQIINTYQAGSNVIIYTATPE